MALSFYPHSEDAHTGTLDERIEVLLEAARQYKALILDSGAKSAIESGEIDASTGVARIRVAVPREIDHSYNWEDISSALRLVRDLPEANKEDKATKSFQLTKLAEVYEVLRGARMSKLEAVRLALVNEAKQLQGGTSASVV